MDEVRCAPANESTGRRAVQAVPWNLWLARLLLVARAEAVLAAVVLAASAIAQGNPPRQPALGSQQGVSPGRASVTEYDDLPRPEELERLRLLNADRQKTMVSDTNRLLRLVNELSAEISASHENSLTPVQLRKLAEIEKLAHSVKEKMSTSLVGPPVFRPPIFPGR
jgi:negative regulator of sigma E activity